jgi:RNA polymerase sigma factor (sigma-70 family)
MANTQLTSVVRHIRRLVTAPEMKDKSDGQLLHDFHAVHDERAFSALVDRHGAMVLRVCRHVLQHEQDAEDAFQATFLVLARKAASLWRSKVIAGWLRSVAYRIALQARRNSGRRLARESYTCLRPPGNPAADVAWREVQVILNEEIERLSEKHRLPFVLCCVEGHSRADVARQLGIKEGTVWSRLSHARRQLQTRLARRGIDLGAALAAASVAEAATASALPALLVASTVRAVMPAGKGVGGLSTEVASLAQDALRYMTLAKLKTGFAIVFLTGMIGAGIGVSAVQTRETKSPTISAPARSEEAKAERKKPTIRSDSYGDPLPDGALARLGTIRFNHGADLQHLLFTPDGKTIISEGRRRVRLWDAATGAEIGRSPEPEPLFGLTTLALDGKVLVSLNEESAGDIVRWWDVAQQKEVRTLRLPGRRSVWSASHRNALSPDGKLAAVHVHTPAALRVFDLETGRELHKFSDGGKDIRAIVFAGNDRLVTADKKHMIAVREARTGKLLREFHGSPVNFLTLSPDGRRLAGFESFRWAEGEGAGNVIHLWDLATGQREQTLRLPPKGVYEDASFSPDGKYLVTSSFRYDEDQVTVWDAATGRKIREFDGVGKCMAFSPDGKRLVEGGWNGKFEMWDPATGHRFSSEDTRHSHSTAACLSPAGDQIVTIGISSINTWDSTTGKRLDSFALPPDLYSDRASHTPDGRLALGFVRDGEAYQAAVWDIRERRKRLTLPTPGQSVPGSTALSADGSLLATAHPGKENVVRIWNASSGKEVRVLKAGKAWRFFFSRDNKTLFLAGPKIVAVDLASGKELYAWRVEPLKSALQVGTIGFNEDDRVAWRALAISPDSTTIAAIHWTHALNAGRSSGEDRVALYDLATGRLLHQWNDSGLQANMLEALTFSDDGRLLASSDQTSIHVWETATGAKLRTFHGHRAEITSLGFDHDSRRLVSSSFDSTVLCWDLTGRMRGGKLQPLHLTAADLDARWRDLADCDAAKAYRAIWELTASGEQAVSFLKRHLHPVPHPDPKRIVQLISELDSTAFAVRQSAFAELKKMDVLAAQALRKTMRANPPLELRRRIESLLQGIHAPVPSAEILRALRAVAVLEHIGSQPARQFTRTLAKGAPDARLTREAGAALGRLSVEPRGPR